jgi:hypothetical protein
MINPKDNKDWLSKNQSSNNFGLTQHLEREVVDSTFSLPGLVHEIGELVEHDSGFTKQELVIVTNDYKPTLVKFEFLNKSTIQLFGLGKNEKVKVTFRIEGREWEGRVLNNVVGTKVEKISEQKVDMSDD